MRLCALLLLIFVAVGCDNRFEYVLPVEEPRMVVNFVSRDSQPWKGTVTLSLPILEVGVYDGIPGGATVNVYENGTLIETMGNVPYDPYDRTQTTLLSSPTAGTTYTIEALSADYVTAHATYTHPMPVPIENFEIELIGPDPEFQNEDAIQFRVTFVDPPGENFYGVQTFGGWNSDEFHGQYYSIFFEDPTYENVETSHGAIRYFDDAYFDGQRVTMTFRARASFKSIDTGMRPEDWYDYHWVELTTFSKSYYRYLQTVELQFYTYGDPYAQPVKVETNVKNGFGVVGGYTTTAKGKDFVY